MQFWPWALTGFIAYILGVILIVKVTPRLCFYAYDDIWFTGLAVLNIFGALFVFGGIFILIAVSNGGIIVKIFNLMLLVFLVFLTGRLAVVSFRGARVKTYVVQREKHVVSRKTYVASRYIAGIFSLFLLLAALFYIVQMVTFS